MDLSALAPDGSGTFEPVVELGIGPAELFVAAGLVYSLAFVYVVGAVDLSDDHRDAVRATLLAGTIPLLLTFASVVAYTSITVV